MLALFTCLRRHPRLTRAEFQDHWGEHHATFGARHPAVRRYIQYHTLDTPVTDPLPHLAGFNSEHAYDGLAVMWFDGLDSLRRWTHGDSFAEVQADEERFVDRARSVAVLTDEIEKYPCKRPYGILMIGCLVRPGGMDDATFHQNWHEHIKCAEPVYEAGLLTGYFQCHGVSASDRATADLGAMGYGGNLEPTELNLEWDGFNRGYYDSMAALRAMGADAEWSAPTRGDEERFLDHERCVGQLSRRHVVKDDLIR